MLSRPVRRVTSAILMFGFGCQGTGGNTPHPALNGAQVVEQKKASKPSKEPTSGLSKPTSVNAPAGQTAVKPLAPMAKASQGAKPDTDPTQKVETFCQGCHALPLASQFTRETWEIALKQKYSYFKREGIDLTQAPSKRELVEYFKQRAAQTIIPPSYESVAHTLFPIERHPIQRKGLSSVAADVASVQSKDGFGGDFVISDMLSGEIRSFSTSGDTDPVAIGKGTHLARFAVGDLDGDGRQDVIAGELGTFGADDHKKGGVLWFRQTKPKSFQTKTLKGELGRVADVGLVDFDKNGQLDVVVAEFGWLTTGSVQILPNAGSPKPGDAVVIDRGRGAVSVASADFDKDGDLDLAVLFAQEREEVIVYLNEGGFKFKKKRVFAANNPLWGATKLLARDIDKDGDVDLLVSNGDNLDAPRVGLFQGIHLLENKGSLTFAEQQIGMLPGVQDFDIFDVDHDGDLDVVAVSSLPATVEKMIRRNLPADKVLASAVVLLQGDDLSFTTKTIADDAPCFNALALVGSGADTRVLVGHFGIGWDVLGHQQTVTNMQGALSNCTDEFVAELWTLGPKARGEKGIAGAPPPVAHRDQSRGRIFRRVDALNQMLASEPSNVNYLMSLGVALSQLGQNKKALETMKKATELQPENVGMKSNVATLLNDMGEPEEALKFAEEALAQRPSMVEALNAKAISLARQFKMTEAIEVAEKVVQVKPQFIPFWANLVQLCVMAKRFDDALRHLQGFEAVAPGHPAIGALRHQVLAAKNNPGADILSPAKGVQSTP